MTDTGTGSGLAFGWRLDITGGQAAGGEQHATVSPSSESPIAAVFARPVLPDGSSQAPGRWCEWRGRPMPRLPRDYRWQLCAPLLRRARDSALDGHAVESLYVPCIRPSGVAVHKGSFFNKAPSLTARHVDYHCDPVHHAPTGHVPREITPALHRTARQSRERALGVVGVDGREGAAVSGVEGLQEVGRFTAAHLADDDVIGSVAQGVADEIADRNGSLLQPARLKPDAVRRINPQLEGVLDGDDPFVVGQQIDEGVEQRGLAAAGPTAHKDVPAGVQHPLGLLADVLGEGALFDELRGRKRSLPKPPHGDGNGRAGRRNTDRHARAVVQARIEDRRRGRVHAQRPGDMDRRPLQRRRVECGRIDRPQPAVAFEPDVSRPVDHDFAHVGIVECGLQAGQERFQKVQPVTAHSWPACFAFQ